MSMHNVPICVRLSAYSMCTNMHPRYPSIDKCYMSVYGNIHPQHMHSCGQCIV